jgi:hypothetical protein
VPLRVLSYLRLLYLCCFSKPASDRPIYQAIRRGGVRKIVELGLGDGLRALHMIEVAKLASCQSEVHYVGMDPFEARTESDGPMISLKAAYQLLSGKKERNPGPPAKVQLVPGNPSDGLIRMANSLGKVDLLIVPAEFDSPSYARMWYFVPRMLHDSSLVFVDGALADGQRCLRPKLREEIDRLASLGSGRRAA